MIIELQVVRREEQLSCRGRRGEDARGLYMYQWLVLKWRCVIYKASDGRKRGRREGVLEEGM